MNFQEILIHLFSLRKVVRYQYELDACLNLNSLLISPCEQSHNQINSIQKTMNIPDGSNMEYTFYPSVFGIPLKGKQ